MLQAGISRIQFLVSSLSFFNLSKPSSHILTMGSTQLLTETSTRNVPEGKVWPSCDTDNLYAIRPPQPVTRMALLFSYFTGEAE
jgi:hypothetical protein